MIEISEQVVNLLASGAAIITMISGLNGFLGNTYISISRKFFYFSTISLLLVFIKEIMLFFCNVLPAITLFAAIFIIIIYLNNNDSENIDKESIFASVVIFLVFLTTTAQKYIINIRINDYNKIFCDYIDSLNNLLKIIDIYKFMFSNSNIVYTFSNLLNILIVILGFYLIYRVNNYLENENENIYKIACYSIILLFFSCGCGAFLMNAIVEKF